MEDAYATKGMALIITALLCALLACLEVPAFIANSSTVSRFASVTGALGPFAPPMIFVVTNTGDSGSGSLRQALQDANNNAGSDTINFNIPGTGVQTITVLSGLPGSNEPIVIDGTTQPGFAGAPLIELNGNGVGGDGLVLLGGSSTIRGLIINRFSGNGITTQNSGNNLIAGNYIGTNAAGTAASPNGQNGIQVLGPPATTIGGLTAADRNIISGNSQNGIVMQNGSASGNVVVGNYIGTDVTGMSALGNGANGIRIDAPSEIIGGGLDGARNIISGNTQAGIVLINSGSTDNRVQGNYIGTDVTGNNALPNEFGVVVGDLVALRGVFNCFIGTDGDGVNDATEGNLISGNTNDGVVLTLGGTTNNRVAGNRIGTNAAGTAALANGGSGVLVNQAAGGDFIGTNGDGVSDALEANLLSGNTNSGIMITDGGTNNNMVAGNLIGTNAAGTGAIPNGVAGVFITASASNNTVGGTVAGSGNVISANPKGVVIGSSAADNSTIGNVIRQNSIFGNDGPGIDLGNDGVTPNDTGDGDNGPNNLQNFPVVTDVQPGSTSIQFTLNSAASTTFRVEFFSNATADPSTFGEGQTFIGFVDVTTDGSGNFTGTFTSPTPASPCQVTTATATNPGGNTSEFSNAFVVAAAAPTITPGGPTTFCQGGSVTLTSSSASANQWYLNGNPIGGATNQDYVATASGSYTVTTDGCSANPSAPVLVTVNPLPSTPTITPGGSTTFCEGGSVTLTSSSASGNQWYLNGNPIGGATNQNYVATGSGNYTVTVTDGNGCTSAASAPTTVTVNPLPSTPAITPGGPTTFCEGGSVTLTSSSASGNQWYLNGNPIGGETNQTYVASATGNYTVRVTDSNGCQSAPSGATSVTVNPTPATPTITPGGPTTFCEGGSVTLTSSSASGNQWYLNGNPIGGETNQTHVASATGNYTVRVTDGNSCQSASSGATSVTVNPTPPPPAITPSGPTTFCAGGSVTLTSSNASGNQWYLNGNPIGGETNQNYVATATGNYTIQVTDGNGCTSAASVPTTVTVNPTPPTPAITPGGPTTFCAGGSVTLTSSSASGNQWYLAGNPIGGATNQNYVAIGSGNYTVSVTDGNGCTSAASAVTTVTVNPLPATPTITPGGPTTFCEGGSVTLTSSSASGNQWYLNGNPIGGATNQTYLSTATGNYTVQVTDGNSCQSAPSGSTSVTVNPTPATPTITPGGPTTFCDSGSVTLTSSSASGNQWYLNGNPIGGETNQTYVATATGNYTVQVTDANSCQSSPSGATSVTVNPIPPTPAITPGGSTTACDSLLLTSSSTSGNQWYLNGNPIGGATNQTYSATASGDYTVVVTASGCSSAPSATTSVTVQQSAATVINTNDSGAGSLRDAIANVCLGGTINFDPALNGQTITLTSGELLIDKNLTIQGPGANLLTVMRSTAGGTPDFRIFAITPGKTVSISSLTINNGTTTGDGAGINNQATLSLSNCSVTGNQTSASGGGVANDAGGTLVITESTISGNTGTAAGAGIANGGTLTLINSTISGNTGDGLSNDNIANLTNDTFSNNSVGGITSNGGATTNVRNTIVANTPGSFGDVGGAFNSQGNNLIGKSDGSSGFTNGANNDKVGTVASPLNALLAVLGNYGGPTQTHALLPGSAAINAANNCVTDVTHCGDANLPQLTNDQRGFGRQIDGTVDMGAFESRGFTIAATNGTPQSAVFNTGFGAPLVATVSSGFGEPVDGGDVTFTAPGAGASAIFPGGVTTINVVVASGQSSVTATANGTVGGPYNVTAIGNGITGPADFSLTNTTANQTINFGAITNKTFGDPDFEVNATASSGLPVSLAASGNCTVTSPSPGTVHLTSAGSCTITAAQAGDTNYNPAADVPQSFTIDKANQTITFGALATKTFGDPDFGVSATATSGLPVAFAASGNCTVTSPSPGTVHLTGAGSCTITASQAGDANYNAAADVPQSFTIDKANQTITFGALANKTFGDPDFGVSATATSGLPVAFAASGNCTVTSPSPGTVHLTGAGSCTITASQAGDANYNAAADVPQSFTIDKANQTITFGALATKTFGDPDFGASATATSGLPVAFAASGNCTVTSPSPGTVHLTGAGSCTITASQAGDANYNAAADVPQSFTIDKADQTITFGALANKTFGDPDFGVSATATSGLPVAFAASGNCTVTSPSPGTVHLTGAGSCTITASQAGDANYNAAADVPQSFTIDKANQTITFGALATKTFGDPDFGVSATAGSGLPVSFVASGNCTVTSPSPGTVHLTGAGSCTITASQAGDANYNAAANVPQSFTIDKTNQTITFGALANKTFGDPDFGASATATSGLPVAFAASGNCTVTSPSPGTVHLTSAGSCTITAAQAGDANYNAATDVPQSFTIAAAQACLVTVTNTNDVGAGSLRQAIIDVCDGGTINFSLGAGPHTISLTSGELLIDKNLTINGPGADLLTISGNNASRVFDIQAGMTVGIDGLTITDGNTLGDGGGIANHGTLTLLACAVANSSSTGSGGGIVNVGGATMTITGSTITGNTGASGAGIANGGALTIVNSTISANNGSGFANSAGTATITNSTFCGNASEGIDAGVTVNIGNTIVAKAQSNNADVVGTFNSQGNNLIGDKGSSTGFTNGVNGDQVGTSGALINPLLGALGNNGGPTQTQALLPGSPAIDAGSNTLANSAGLISDQRGMGFDRIVNPTVDIGAFESRGFTISNTSGTPQSAVFSTAFGAPLVVTVSSGFGEPVDGGEVTFTAPGAGASATFTGGVTTINVAVATGQASASATANATVGGPYNVTAKGNGITGTADFSLANTTANQTINFGAIANKTFGDPDFAVNATASSGLPVSLAASGNCTVTSPSPGTVHLTGGGSCAITAAQAGDANYNAATNVPQSFTINKANQTITFNALANKTFGDPDFAVNATASSGLPVSLAANGNCTVTSPSPGTVHLTGAGSCAITAAQAGDANYNAATNVPQSFTINKASQTITFNALANKTFGDPDFAVNATASSGLPVSLAASGNCTVTSPSPGTVHLTGAGSCAITAAQAGDANYNPATNVPQSFTINKANQTITFNALANKTFGDPDFAVNATASSGLPVSLAASGNCTVTSPSPGTVHLTGAGSCAITAAQAGDANYNPATNVLQSFTIVKSATSTALSSTFNPSDLNQSLAFRADVSPVALKTGTVQFKDNGNNLGAPVALDNQGVALLTTSSLTAGTHTITAEYGGDANFLPSTATLSGGQVVRAQPSLSINDVSISEGNAGTKVLSFTITLSGVSHLAISVDYATANGTATAPSDYTAIASTLLPFNPGDTSKTVSVTINGDVGFEPDETFFVNLSNPVNATISDNQGLGTIQNDDVLGGFISFSQANTSVNESTGIVTLTVVRTNDVSQAVNVEYATDDTGASTNCAASNTGLASQRCDYTSMFGTLKFAANETQKTIDIPINLDAYNEGPETFTVKLSSPTGGAVLAVPSTATVTMTDSASPTPNAIDDTTTFVRQQYRDFLNRDADAAGLAFWKNNIDKCNDPAQRPPGQTLAACIEMQRITTSAAFFLSIEFKQTGGMVRDFYVAALDRPLTNNMPGFVEFMRDTQAIQKGVIVGQGNWQQVLEANRTAYMNEFVTRAEFVALYPTTDTPAQYVDKLYLHAGVTPANPGERNAAIAEFGGAGTAADPGARGRALLRVTQNTAFQARETNRAFVQMEYFGYLRRNPNDAPDNNFNGFNFWVNKLNQFNGDYLQAEMVKAFLTSLEYRQRFGP